VRDFDCATLRLKPVFVLRYLGRKFHRNGTESEKYAQPTHVAYVHVYDTRRRELA